jgi:hypothetical protein
MAFFYYGVNPWPETTQWPLRPLLSAGRRDAAVWASRLRSGNFVWCHALHIHMYPSTGCRCRLAFAQVVAAGPKRNFTPLFDMRFFGI